MDSGILDEAYQRLHHTGPEYEGWLSNHGPMAVEALIRHGHDRVVHRWLDGYLRRLDELPRGTAPIEDWRAALGDPKRAGDWLAYFAHELDQRPWPELLGIWWPRLLPGIAAGATHGVSGSARCPAQRRRAPNGSRERQALGYWPPLAARTCGSTDGTADYRTGRVPLIAERSGGIHTSWPAVRRTRLRGVAARLGVDD
jgi:hypothetical protein